MNKFKVIVGDESNDGHGMWDTVYFESNFNRSDLNSALSHAGSSLAEPIRDLFRKYEDNKIPKPLVEELQSHGWELPEECEEYDGKYHVHGPEGLVRFYLSVIKTFTANLEYRIVSDDTQEFSLPSSGYGLYH